ncbi:lysylphosphatidylglycerol synthase transmembrane domain-containing protein [Sinomonas humi]|uniref:Flippase-like domain-containing protein n=1 Tax=Sinomonas humi TaxID=1338436 RepID=A0A0B2AGQ5_9MICC|nr:lysylphosphatidylglycerol synthase transmembrane domain-containing protein [Sinomonas humi]KHL00962.1 hypothetical protein LK10_18380 [Sinomonas humi]
MAAKRTGQDGGPDTGHDASGPKRMSRYARLRLSIGRHPSDVVRMAVAAGVVLACRLVAVAPGTNPVEAAIASQLQRLPSWSAPIWEGLTWLGSWPGIVAAVGLALYIGRIRLGISLAFAAAAAWLLAVVVSWTVPARLVPPGVESGLLHASGAGAFAFPDSRSAVIAALASVSTPYLTRVARNTSWILVVLVAAADVFLGQNLPVGVFAGVVLGWGMGKLFHIVMGAPGRRASESALQQAVERAGLSGARIVPVHRGLLSPQEYEITAEDGTLFRMKTVRRLHRRAGPLHKLSNAFASVDVEHGAGLSTPLHEVEHEAYITLLAERAGVGTVPVVLAGEIEHGPPFLISRAIGGHPLSSLSANDISESLLDAIWANVKALESVPIAHHDLRAQNIIVDDAGRPRISSFTFSRVGGPAGGYRQDAAEMLVSLAAVVGPDRAVASILRAFPRAALLQVLPYLQRMVLHRRLRRQLPPGAGVLARLREGLAEQIEAPVPSLRLPVRPSTIIVLLVGGLAVYLLLPEFSNIDQVLVLLERGDSRWLAATVVIGFLAILASAVSLLGSCVPRLPIRKTIAVQAAAAFTGRTTAAGIGFYRINWVYLERIGFRGPQIVAAIGINRLVTGLVSAVGTVLGLVVIGGAVPVGQVGLVLSWPVAAGAAALLLAIVLFLASPFGRRRIVRPGIAWVHEIRQELTPLLRSPLRAAQLTLGCVGYLLLLAAALATTLAAFTPTFPVVPVLAVFVVGSTLGQLAPTPGGLGAVEAAMIAGLTAIGVAPSNAVAAVLSSRLLTYWLPVVPGIVAFRVLQHRGVV